MNGYHSFFPVGAVILATASAGCHSISSTLVERDACNVSTQMTKLKGIPITLQVATHLRVDIVKRVFIQTNSINVLNVGTAPTQVPLSSCDVRTQIINTDKIVMVDMKRPASGGLKWTNNFTTDGYLAGLGYSSSDDTITQVGVAIQQFLRGLTGAAPQAGPAVVSAADPTAPAKAGGTRSVPDLDSAVINPISIVGQKGTPAPNVQVVENVLATQIFALDDPELELKITGFLTKCSGCLQ